MYPPRSLSVRLFLALPLSTPPPHTKISLGVILSSLRLTLGSVCLSLPPSAGAPSSCLLIPSLLHCAFVAHSPTHFFFFFILPSCICLFVSLYTLLSFLSPTDAVCLRLSSSRQDSYFASLSFASPSHSPCVSPDIHVEIFLTC